MNNRFVSADLLFKSQNAAIDLATKLGAAEERIKFLEFEVKQQKNIVYGPAGTPTREQVDKVLDQLRHGGVGVIEMPRQAGKATFSNQLIILELVKMVKQLTLPADSKGRGFMHPSLEYVEQCRERIKGLI